MVLTGGVQESVPQPCLPPLAPFDLSSAVVKSINAQRKQDSALTTSVNLVWSAFYAKLRSFTRLQSKPS